MSASSRNAPSRNPAYRRALNLAKRANANLPFACPECGLTYAAAAGRTQHRRREHGVMPAPYVRPAMPKKPREKADPMRAHGKGPIAKSVSQSRPGFAEARSRVVRGNNADSAEAWLIFGSVMFGAR